MKTVKEIQKATGLRTYSEGVDGVEIHFAGEVVFEAKNKPQAEAFLRGAMWQSECSGGLRATRSPETGAQSPPT